MWRKQVIYAFIRRRKLTLIKHKNYTNQTIDKEEGFEFRLSFRKYFKANIYFTK